MTRQVMIKFLIVHREPCLYSPVMATYALLLLSAAPARPAWSRWGCARPGPAAPTGCAADWPLCLTLDLMSPILTEKNINMTLASILRSKINK